MNEKVHHMGGGTWAFFCPGCRAGHFFRIGAEEGPNWQWNANLEKPTVTPSLMTNRNTETQCHLWIKDGKIQFLADSKHDLAGVTVEMTNWLDT